MIYTINSNSIVIDEIKDHGFSSSNANYSTFSYIYDNPEALYDIDDEPRPSDYSKIDLGADEFAP